MRMSCNGCRVLRKGCSEDCTIKPCLQWIKSPDSQSNATIFLAKFYGRAGLQNLINAGPDHLRPAIFRSLLYEACGRIVNPIYGSAGLLWSGNWHLCHAAVEAVLVGAPIVQVPSESAVSAVSPPLKACDIRHVSKDEISASASRDLHKVKGRGKFKRATAAKPIPKVEAAVDEAAQVIWSWSHMNQIDGSGSGSGVGSVRHESESSHSHHQAEPQSEGEGDCMSVETVEASLVKGGGDDRSGGADESKLELELSLGLGLSLGFESPVRKVGPVNEASKTSRRDELAL